MQPIIAPALENILSFLAPLFLQEAGDDIRLARQATSETLQSYGVTTDQQVRLAALAIAFSVRALDALSRAATPGLDVKAVLRLNGSANALNRAALQCQKALDRLRTGRSTEEVGGFAAEPVMMPDSSQMPDLLAFVRNAIGTGLGTRSGLAAPVPGIGLSRQQRRSAERRAEKATRREQEAALRTDRIAARAAQSVGSPAILPA